MTDYLGSAVIVFIFTCAKRNFRVRGLRISKVGLLEPHDFVWPYGTCDVIWMIAIISLKESLYNMLVVDSGTSNSDHRPLTGYIDVEWDNTSCTQGYVKANKAVSVRWDKANLNLY